MTEPSFGDYYARKWYIDLTKVNSSCPILKFKLHVQAFICKMEKSSFKPILSVLLDISSTYLSTMSELAPNIYIYISLRKESKDIRMYVYAYPYP